MYRESAIKIITTESNAINPSLDNYPTLTNGYASVIIPASYFITNRPLSFRSLTLIVDGVVVIMP